MRLFLFILLVVFRVEAEDQDHRVKAEVPPLKKEGTQDVTRAEAITEGIKKIELDPTALRLFSKGLEEKRLATKEALFDYVNQLSEKDKILTPEQSKKLKKLFDDELSSLPPSEAFAELRAGANKILAEKATAAPAASSGKTSLQPILDQALKQIAEKPPAAPTNNLTDELVKSLIAANQKPTILPQQDDGILSQAKHINPLSERN